MPSDILDQKWCLVAGWRQESWADMISPRILPAKGPILLFTTQPIRLEQELSKTVQAIENSAGIGENKPSQGDLTAREMSACSSRAKERFGPH